MRSEVQAWVAQMVKEYKPRSPILEVGAREVAGGTIRHLFPQDGYVGLDLEAGTYVDLVASILDMPKELRRKFNTVVTAETLEHITEPWRALEQMYAALRPGGLFIGTWVFVCGIHNEPDYWRATPAGFAYLLKRAGFIGIEISLEGGNEANPVGVFAVARKKP